MDEQHLTPVSRNIFNNYDDYTDFLMDYISSSLMSLGFRAKLKGFVYTKEAIFICIRNYRMGSITDIYEKIAMKYNITVTSVEHAIRYAIDYAWYKDGVCGDHELFNRSGLKKDTHPSNTEFIATMAELINILLRINYMKSHSC